MLNRLFPLVILLMIAVPCHSEDTPLEFGDSARQHRYMDLIEEIRCLVCQNQSLADSHADLAQDLRQEIFDMINKGMNNEEIIEFLVQRYGDFVLYRPPFKGTTILLWLLPFLFLMVAIGTVIYFIRFRTSNLEVAALNEEDRKKLDRALADYKDGGEGT